MKRLVSGGMTVLIMGGLLSVLVVGGLMIGAGSKTQAHEEVDYLIVLGAGLHWDVISLSLKERLDVSRDYLVDNEHIKVIVSGGQGPDEKFSEAYAMSEYLVQHGIDRQRVILEDKSRNTLQNLSFSLEKIKEMDQKENQRVLIASNKYHLFRAKMLAKRLDMVPYGLPAQTPPAVVVKSYVREYFAVIKSLLFDRV